MSRVFHLSANKRDDAHIIFLGFGSAYGGRWLVAPERLHFQKHQFHWGTSPEPLQGHRVPPSGDHFDTDDGELINAN